eukprot:scaffold2069_cov187-Amphora_coffeaeformis.AAC.13
MTGLSELFLLYACPSIGILLGTAMNAAPVRSLATALEKANLGSLNTVVWAFAAGNAFGWIVYGYLTQDFFVLMPNILGLLINLWLNYGAAKLQYYELQKARLNRTKQLHSVDSLSTAPTTSDDSVQSIGAAATASLAELPLACSDNETVNKEYFVPQEVAFFRIAALWMTICVCTGWFVTDTVTVTCFVGLCVNLNLVVFYASPLQTVQTVVAVGDAGLIHRPTMMLNFVNAFFWFLYGVSHYDRVIFFPNGVGSLLGVAQMVLCAWYPSRLPVDREGEPLLTVRTNLDGESSSYPIMVV